MIEIELKFRIQTENIRELTRLLKHNNFSLRIQRTYEKTVMYDNPYLVMQTTNGRIRLRLSGSRCELSYKRPLARSGVKKEIEYEVRVSDFEVAEKILEMMEFWPVTSYERYRTVFTSKNGGVKVAIDEYPFAVFFEIEGKKKNIKRLACKLGFSLKDNLIDPCDTLFQKWRVARSLPFKSHMLFKNYEE